VRRVVFFGGNGHCAARLSAAREALAGHPLLLEEAAYPGFEGRPRAASWEAFLDATTASLGRPDLVYATGIGGLVVLALRGRGALGGVPVVLQAPVLWGLAQRRFPRLMRVGLVRRLAPSVFAWGPTQRLLAGRLFCSRTSPALRRAFFDGYRRCAAFGDLFAWLTPELLKTLEAQLAAHPRALDEIEVWWGGRDAVVGVEELRLTESALGCTWPLRIVPEWGHYPMIDAPEEWAAAVAATLTRKARA
jgi:pimeloyl-ACP methyl ester carboxylesterase